MHLPTSVIPSDVQASIIAGPSPGLARRAKRRLKWWFDIDDGGGAITVLAGVFLIFGTLFVHLVELNRRLDAQPMSCKVVDTTTLQVRCQFE
jgi:hypothetical protein